MFFNKIHHPANFRFASRRLADGAAPVKVGARPWAVRTEGLGADVFCIHLDTTPKATKESQAELDLSFPAGGRHDLQWDRRGLVLRRKDGETLLEGVPGATFGVCGDAWMLQFRHETDMQFYGLGEHCRGFEKSGQRVKFWNNDLWAEFPLDEIRHGSPNPMYVSLPYLIIKRGNTYLGLLLNHPGAVFMDLASSFIWSPENREDRERQSFFLGAPTGAVELYVLVGPTLAELTRKLQTLVGRTPLPPLWALGHHQCRWGYAGPDDLRALDREFRERQIPTDGLWLDIDYMERYKVFSWDPARWGDETAVRAELAALRRAGRRVVPILDPGVKVEAGYEVMEDGLRRSVFCLNPEGKPYVGFVWPGRTYYPDFSLPAVRTWWSERVRRFAALGAGGAWLDMNDPSVGAVELDDMLFDRGRQRHEAYHNQYALGMAQASREGFLAARPHERPFLLSRSAFISSSRYTAVWTGDNYSNWRHLRASLPLSLGLALSGQPFNGPDVAGFGDDTSPELAIAWYKAGFLFPFFRNHSTHGSRRQEPWALGRKAERIIARYIRLRYRLLPYLYQLFVAQEETGEAILRPLFYDFADTRRLPLGNISDQFLVGPAILQAPVVDEGARERRVALPGRGAWYDATEGRWCEGGGWRVARSGDMDTPLYFREGSIVAAAPGDPVASPDLATVDLHVFLRRASTVPVALDYVWDDGLTFAYRNGERSRLHIEATVKGACLEVRFTPLAVGAGAASVRVWVYAPFATLRVLGPGTERTLSLRPQRVLWTGRSITARCSSRLTI